MEGLLASLNNLGWSFLKDVLWKYPALRGLLYTLNDLGWAFVGSCLIAYGVWCYRKSYRQFVETVGDKKTTGGKLPEIVIDVSPEDYTQEYNRRMGITTWGGLRIVLPGIITFILAPCFFAVLFYGAAEWHYANKANADQVGKPYEGTDWCWLMRGLVVFLGLWFVVCFQYLRVWLEASIKYRSITRFFGTDPIFLPVQVACKHCGTAIEANSSLIVLPGSNKYEVECSSCKKANSIIWMDKGCDQLTSMSSPEGIELCYLCGKRLGADELASRVCTACRE
jgi:hypothetical protein